MYSQVDRHMTLLALSKCGVGWSSLRSRPGSISCPQGSGLGPDFCFLFINDILENIRSSFRRLADDCVLYRNIKSPTDCKFLQDNLNSLAQS